MASVFAGRMILEVFLHSLKKGRGFGETQPRRWQTNCLPDGI